MKQTVRIIGFRFPKTYLIFLLLFGFIILEIPFSLKSDEEYVVPASDALASPYQPTWVIDPTNPGEDSPPVGRSLFDHLVSRHQGESKSYDIPYPFSALLRSIEKTAVTRTSSPRFTVLVIPFGRSLHRYAAQPDFLQFPRILATVDTDATVARETRETTDSVSASAPLPFYLKDRLFLAFQEKAAMIEVISYNEAAGRFEFQIVRNYRPDTTPQVIYANRKVCTVCHQHHAPIFPEPLWHETNAHPTIHALLQATRQDLSSLVHGVDIAAAFDAATDRANEILVPQKLWQEGCETPALPQQSIECRANLLILALQQGLSGKSPLLDPTPSPKNDIFPSLLQTWQAQWPHGLWLPNPNIPNRSLADVLAFIAPNASDAYFSPKPDVGLPRIHPLLDPVIPRPPLGTLTFMPQDLSPWIQILTSLSNLFSQADMQALDRQLVSVARHQQIPAMPLHSRCNTTIRSESESVVELKLECSPSSEFPVEPGSSFSLKGRLRFQHGQFHHGTVHRLRLDNHEEHAHLSIREAVFQKDDASDLLTLLLTQSPSGLHARTHGGNLIQSLVLDRPPPLSQPGLSPETLVVSDATLNIVPDFPLVQEAVKTMINETVHGHTEALGYAPFRRMKLVQSLLHHLDPPAQIECCEMPPDLPPVVLDAHPSSRKIFARTNTSQAPLQLLDRFCGDCHHGVDPAPPNFLHGSVAQVNTNLAQCAERMHVRLGMWNVAPAERGISPMPPPTALPRLTPMPGHWSQQEEFRLLSEFVQELIAMKGDSPAFDAHLTPHDYAALPECLPASTSSLSPQPDS